jgi:hypothetical protein
MLNSLLLDERYDEIILSDMMYQPINEEMKIKAYVGEDIEDAIYDLLSDIETFNSVKL